MSFDPGHDKPITKIIKIIYEAEGMEHEAVPINDAEARAAGIPAPKLANEDCDGSYICIDGWRYRLMLNHETKKCQYFRTSEVC
jgi:hypothetical protein